MSNKMQVHVAWRQIIHIVYNSMFITTCNEDKLDIQNTCILYKNVI